MNEVEQVQAKLKDMSVEQLKTIRDTARRGSRASATDWKPNLESIHSHQKPGASPINATRAKNASRIIVDLITIELERRGIK